jgi:glucose/arabinose dehydrogenase
VDQPAANHNGGDLAFGPEDGYLYIALGDGGRGNDPQNRAQALDELLGKILRLDVSGGGGGHPPDCGEGPYRVPSSNPFAANPVGACDEIWALGLRNPWRFSFYGDQIFIADVGQTAWEEVNVQPIAGGRNYGWSCYEGTHPNPNTAMPTCPAPTAYTMPAFEYSHDDGCAVTGGYVYRGQDFPALAGHYLFADYCSGIFWAISPDGAVTRHENLQAHGYSTFGEGADGELYVANVLTGELFRVTGTTSGAQP